MELLLKKATRQHTKDHNSRLVLRTIYDYGEVSRADLARLTQLTRTTVSDVVAGLIEQGLVEEIGHAPSSVGRTPILLGVVEDARCVVAVNVSTRAVEGAVVNLRGAVRQRATRVLTDTGRNGVLDQLYSLADELISGAPGALLGIGVSAPGLIDTTSGIVRRAVYFDWNDLPLAGLLQARYQLPVYVANDSHTVALAEYMFSPDQPSANLVVVKVGQGIGAGVVLNGQLFYGDGFGAGEIGHVVVAEGGRRCACGNTGCLETVAGTGELVRRARELAAVEPRSALHRFAPSIDAIDLDVVLQAFLAGDPAVEQMIADVGRFLGMAVASLVGVLNVRRIIITGRVAPFGLPLCQAIRQEMHRRVLPVLAQGTEVTVVEQHADTVLLGAAALLLTNELGLARLTHEA